MYKDLNRYLEPGLKLLTVKARGFLDLQVRLAYHSVTKNSIKKRIATIKKYKHTSRSFNIEVNKLSAEEKRRNKRIDYWNKKNGVKVKFVVEGEKKKYFDNRPTRIKSQEKQRKLALKACIFMLDNFETKINASKAKQFHKRSFRNVCWLTKEQKNYMAAVKKEAKILRANGLNVHVDHIIPLCGKNISGLNVPDNIEIIPGDVNFSKNNKWEVA